MRRHRETFITADDFRWLVDHGINAIRLPLGFWLFDDEPPFVGGAEMADYAVELCDQFGLKLNIDLHGLPGHQGKEMHTGRAHFHQWGHDPSYLAKSLDLIEQVAQRYKDRDCVNAFSLVNEPDIDLPASFLQDFYDAGYERVRRHMPARRVAVVVAAFTEKRLPEFHRKTAGDNVLTDIHPYACFSEWDAGALLDYVAWGLAKKAPAVRQARPDDLLIGEWSLGVAPAIKPSIVHRPTDEQDLIMRAFATNQLLAYEQAAAWYFWTYRAECNDPFQRLCWSYRDAAERGWMPTFDPVAAEAVARV